MEAIPAADRMFSELAAENRWDVFVIDNAGAHSPDILGKFQLVVWNNVSGDVLTTDQRESLLQWLDAGGGWAGVHGSSGDLSYDWDWYVNALIGAQFHGHTSPVAKSRRAGLTGCWVSTPWYGATARDRYSIQPSAIDRKPTSYPNIGNCSARQCAGRWPPRLSACSVPCVI